MPKAPNPRRLLIRPPSIFENVTPTFQSARFKPNTRRLENRRYSPETVYLVAAARKHGASAASAFGAGFGGSVWALVPTRRVTEFLAEWKGGYRDRFPQHDRQASFFATAAGPALSRVG